MAFIRPETLPVYHRLPEISEKIKTGGVILRAAPGAGKTMLVPPLFAEAVSGKVLLIEPRRVAAKAAAAGIAEIHSWTVGREVGFIVRGESCCSAASKIIAVTPGVALSQIQQDPGLTGIDALIFDEFHERGVENDLMLAFAADIRNALRPELKIGIVSATMESGEIERFLQLPAVDVPGREFPVEYHYRGSSGDLKDLPSETASAVMESCRKFPGDILVFLPGKREIDQCYDILLPHLEDDVLIFKLHGSLPLEEQTVVLQSAPQGKRKIILSTNIAESSLTIDGVQVVVDSGWERRMTFMPGAGMPFLIPERISLASARQRAGRAGRTAAGNAVRLWDKAQERNFPEFHRAEITECDLSFPALQLSAWGCRVDRMQWLTPPPEAGWSAAEKLLRELKFIDSSSRLTELGRKAVNLPVHPRMAAMLLHSKRAGQTVAAVELALMLQERWSGQADESADISERLLKFRKTALRNPSLRREKEKLLLALGCRENKADDDFDILAELIACAYPEWVGRARKHHGTVYQLSGGRAAVLKEGDYLRSSEFLTIAELSGFTGSNAVIRQALPIEKCVVEKLFADVISDSVETFFDPATSSGGAKKVRKFGGMILQETPAVPDAELLGRAVIAEAVRRKLNLPPPSAKGALRLLERIRYACEEPDLDLPDWREEQFYAQLPELVLPFVPQLRSFAQLENAPWREILRAAVNPEDMRKLDKLYPDFYISPAGMEFKIDYSENPPAVSLQVQQLYGEKVHPSVGSRRLPLKLILLSPAQKPVQITSDLPGFWQGTWKLVRAEMKSRYPKHEWPEFPADAEPMRRSVKKSG